jgi:hypothetical protein
MHIIRHVFVNLALDSFPIRYARESGNLKLPVGIIKEVAWEKERKNQATSDHKKTVLMPKVDSG